MSIDLLKRIVPPPSEPLYPGSEDEWLEFQKKIGLRFPVDYFALVNTYGSGRFLAGELKVANPFDPDDERFADRELTRLRETRANFPDEVPFPLFPDSGGLYPFGIDGNGNTFLWKTDAEPDQWAVVCVNSEDYSEVTDHSLVDFLVFLHSNQLHINRRKFWGSDFARDATQFIPRKQPPRQRRRKVRSNRDDD